MVSTTIPCETETMLTLLETWLTTHTSSPVRGFTETGPSPTGIWASKLGLAGVVTSNTESDAFGVFTANRRVPSAERRTVLGFASSKLAKTGGGACARVVMRDDRAASTARNIVAPTACLTNVPCLKNDITSPLSHRSLVSTVAKWRLACWVPGICPAAGGRVPEIT